MRESERKPDGSAGEERAPAIQSGSPASPLAQRVLALQRQAGNAAVVRLLQRQPGPPAQSPPAAQAGMSRAAFETAMRTRFSVPAIRIGTQAQQTSGLTPRGGAPAGGIVIPSWQTWDPGPNSTVYDAIVGAFEDVERTMGGIPPTDEIVFYEMAYSYDSSARRVVPEPDTGATFGSGRLTIFHALARRLKGLPIGRSNAAGNYPNAPVATLGTGGAPKGAPLAVPTRDESMRRLIAHELGHGFNQVAMGPGATDPNMLREWQVAVGWTATGNELFDIGEQAVQDALRANPPRRPTTAQITPALWNDPRWQEQPISRYSVEGGPGEDFAESIMAFIYAPSILRARSPRRHAFISSHHRLWQSRLVRNGRRPDPPAGGAVPPPRRRTPARVLVEVRVVKTEDWTGADEVYVKVRGPGGVERTRVKSLNDGQSHTFVLSAAPFGDFTKPVTIEVYDEDWPDADDLIVRMTWTPPAPARNRNSYDEANYSVTVRPDSSAAAAPR